MAGETIFQHWIVTKFLLPFVLIWGIMYAILEKTKIFGDDKQQLNGIIAAVIGLIFVGAVYPKIVVENMILFLAVAIVILFVILMIWGFVGGGDKETGFALENWMKYTLWSVGGVAVIGAVLWATGVNTTLIDWLFYQSWSSSFWTNFFFVVVVAVIIAVVLKNKE